MAVDGQGGASGQRAPANHRRLAIVFAVLVLVVGIGVAAHAVLGRESDEDEIRKMLEHLAWVMKVYPHETAYTRRSRMSNELQLLTRVDIQVDAENLTAKANVTARLEGESDAGARHDERDIQFSFQKNDERWWIDSIHVVPPKAN
jgi:hypothetical protein